MSLGQYQVPPLSRFFMAIDGTSSHFRERRQIHQRIFFYLGIHFRSILKLTAIKSDASITAPKEYNKVPIGFSALSNWPNKRTPLNIDELAVHMICDFKIKGHIPNRCAYAGPCNSCCILLKKMPGGERAG